MQVASARQAHRRHGPAVAGGAEHVGEGVTAHGVDGRRPLLLLQRLAASHRHLVPGDDAARAEPAQVVDRLGLAGAGDHLVAAPGQQRHRDGAHSARGTGDQHGALPRRQAVVFQPVEGQGRGEPRGAQDHGLPQVEPAGQGHDPAGGHPRVLGVAAVVADPQLVTRHQDRVAWAEPRIRRLHDLPRQVDAGHHRVRPHHPAVGPAGQAVLVVHAGVGHADRDLARGEVRRRQRAHPLPQGAVVKPFHEIRGKGVRHRGRHPPSLPRPAGRSRPGPSAARRAGCSPPRSRPSARPHTLPCARRRW